MHHPARLMEVIARWRNDTTGRALDLRSTGREFHKRYVGRNLVDRRNKLYNKCTTNRSDGMVTADRTV